MKALRKVSACIGLTLFFIAGSCMDCAAPLIPGCIAIIGLLLAGCAVDGLRTA